jgi:hypothetical protein
MWGHRIGWLPHEVVGPVSLVMDLLISHVGDLFHSYWLIGQVTVFLQESSLRTLTHHTRKPLFYYPRLNF